MFALLLRPFEGRLGPLLSTTSLFALVGATACTPAMNEQWVQVETQHIRLRSNQGSSQTVAKAERLQKMRDAMNSSVMRCGFRENQPRLEVTSLYSDHFDEIASEHVAGYYASAPHGAMGVRQEQIVLRGELILQARQIFQHELAHQLIMTCFPAAPIWLNEGLAGFLETIQVKNDVLSVGFPLYVMSYSAQKVTSIRFQGQIITQVPFRLLPSVSQLLQMSAEEFYQPPHKDEAELDDNRTANYAAAWGLVHFLQLGTDELHAHFQRYLQRLGERQDAQSAWQSEFGGYDLDKELLHYLEHTANAYLTRAYRPQEAVQAAVVRELTPTESELQVAWLWGARDARHSQQSRKHGREAIKLSGPNAEASLVIAISFAAEGNIQGAVTELEAGLQAAPHEPSLLALWLFLVLREDQDHAQRETIVDHGTRLRKVASRPEHFAVLALYESSFGRPSQALKDSRVSVDAAPHCWQCWESRALALATTKQWERALDAIERAARVVPHAAPGVLSHLAGLEKELKSHQAADKRQTPSTQEPVIDLTGEAPVAPN